MVVNVATCSLSLSTALHLYTNRCIATMSTKSHDSSSAGGSNPVVGAEDCIRDGLGNEIDRATKPRRTGRVRTVAQLCTALNHILGNEDASLSLSNHLESSRLLYKLQERASLPDAVITGKSIMSLICTGIAVTRRANFFDAQTYEEERIAELLFETANLIFIVLAIMQVRMQNPHHQHHDTNAELSEIADRLKTFEATSVSDLLRFDTVVGNDDTNGGSNSDKDGNFEDGATAVPINKRQKTDSNKDVAREEEITERNGKQARDHANRVVRHGHHRKQTSDENASLILRQAALLLQTQNVESIASLSSIFFRLSSVAFCEKILQKHTVHGIDTTNRDGYDGVGVSDAACTQRRTVSLSVASALSKLSAEERMQKLEAVCELAESEAGQQVLRDMLLSMLLPSSHVGVRRTLLMSRSASTRATLDYPDIVNRAHAVAMGGSLWMFRHSKSEIERLACLLTGLAMLLTKDEDASDFVRNADAFAGRVNLPFFETRPPKSKSVPRLSFVKGYGTWIVYKLSFNGTPEVQLDGVSFENSCDCILCMSEL